MAIYFILTVAIITSWAVISPKDDKSSRRTLAIVVCYVMIFLVMGLRSSEVGVDTSTYLGLYTRTSFTDWSHIASVIDSAFIYNVYSKLLSVIVSNSQAIIIFNSAIICFGFGYFTKCCAKDGLFFTLLFIMSYSFFTSMNIMRQYVAIALILIAFSMFFSRKRLFVPILLLLLSVGVHNSALIAIVVGMFVYLLSKKELSIKMMLVVIGLIIIAFAPVYALFSEYFISLFPRYSMYVGSNANSITSQGQGRQFVFYIAYLLIVLYAHRNFVLDNSREKLLTLIGIVGVFAGIFWSNFVMPARIVAYFLPFANCLITNLLYEKDRDINTVLFRYLALLVFGSVCFYQLISNYAGVVPYEFFWQL